MNLHEVLQDWQNVSIILYPKASSVGSLEHAKEEIDEVITENNRGKRVVEYADILMCVATALKQDGILLEEVAHAINSKKIINEGREWYEVQGKYGLYYKHVKK